MSKVKEEKYCSICGVSEKETSKFYYNSSYGKNLCNKHYLQLKNNGRVSDTSKPRIDDKRIYWTKEEEDLLLDLVNKQIPYKEMTKLLNKSTSKIKNKVARMNIETSYKNSSNYKAIYQEYDWCYQKFIIEGLNHQEMAIESGASKRVIEKWCAEKHHLTQEYRQIHKQLNEKQRDLIIGSILGDGHIDRRENQPIFIVSHAENQKDYLYYKYNILKDLCNIPPVRKEARIKIFYGKEYLCKPSYRISTRVHDCLKEYRGRSNTYLLNLINEFSLAIWILDDASREKSNWTLCIAEYTQDDISFAIKMLKERFGLTSRLKKDIRYLTFDAESSRKIDKIILNNIPNELDVVKYKITHNNKISLVSSYNINLEEVNTEAV